jgi:hypothetical protein
MSTHSRNRAVFYGRWAHFEYPACSRPCCWAHTGRNDRPGCTSSSLRFNYLFDAIYSIQCLLVSRRIICMYQCFSHDSSCNRLLDAAEAENLEGLWYVIKGTQGSR